VRPAWWALCALHLLPGVAALLDPAGFGSLVGLSAAEPHWVRDVGVGELALAVAAAGGALRPAARPALLVVLAVQLVLHTGSHVVDGVGGAVVVSLLLQAALLAAAARSAVPTRSRAAAA
jgi:hypothetical protein